MNIKLLDYDFSILKVDNINNIDFNKEYFFYSKTDEEISIVCKSCDEVNSYISISRGWKGFRIDGVLDFSLIGIIKEISILLANNKIGIFVISTYNTDYVFVKEENYNKTVELLKANSYNVK